VFPSPLTSGQKLSVKFTYAGSVMSEAGGGLLYVGARGTWFPNRGPWMSNFDLQFQYPVGWKLLATGKRIEQETKGSDEISRWVSERPIPLAGFNLGRYVSSSAKSANGTTTVESYAARAMEKAFPERPSSATVQPGRNPGKAVPVLELGMPGPLDPAKNASMVAERSARTIDFLSPRLGPFPYSSLSLTQMPGPDSQGWPGLIFLSSHVFMTPEERAEGRGNNYMDSPEELIYRRLMGAHETAHQWWGDATFWRSYRDQWIMEALANYSALLELEAEDPGQAKSIMDYYRKGLETPHSGAYLPRKDAGPVTLGVRLNSSKYPGAYETVAYGRGTWLIHMLRHMLRDASVMSSNSGATPVQASIKNKSPRTMQPASGNTAGSDPDALFFSALRNVHKKFSGKVMSTQDLQLAFEEVLPKSLQFEGKRSLDWFFEGWVSGTAIPKFELDNAKISSNSGKTVARATLMQKDVPESLITSVPIYAFTADGKVVLLERVFADGVETPININVPAGTKKLLIDPFGTVLKGN
jgi:Peptidase family M1 domain